MEFNIVQMSQNKDWFDFLSQTASMAVQSVIALATVLTARATLKTASNIGEVARSIDKGEILGSFGFRIKGEKGVEKDLVSLALENIGKDEVSFDSKEGVWIRWRDKKTNNIKNHRIDLHENNISGGTQLNYEQVSFNIPQKNIINSKKFRFFIYTTRGKKFELFPSAVQLGKWGMKTIEEWKNGVKDIPKD